MELYIYDKALTLLGVIDELTSLVWTRRYACARGYVWRLLPVVRKVTPTVAIWRFGRRVA